MKPFAPNVTSSRIQGTFPRNYNPHPGKFFRFRCRDPKDDFLLALSKDAGADYLLTGDADLLTLGRFEKTRIMKLADFVREFGQLV